MPMSRRTLFLLLTAIVILASFLRLFHLAAIPLGLYPDEAMDGNSALEAARTAPFPSGMKAFYPENNGREGLYVNALAVVFKVSGAAPEPWIVRLPAAISALPNCSAPKPACSPLSFWPPASGTSIFRASAFARLWRRSS